MWDKADKYGVFMLLWLIAANVVTGAGWFAGIASVTSLGYALMAIYSTFKGE